MLRRSDLACSARLTLPPPNAYNATAPEPKYEWEIDFRDLKILHKVGEGAFGEVFQGRLWGTEVCSLLRRDIATCVATHACPHPLASLRRLNSPICLGGP